MCAPSRSLPSAARFAEEHDWRETGHFHSLMCSGHWARQRQPRLLSRLGWIFGYSGNGSKYPKGQSQATYEFSFIGDMLNDQIVPPKFSAALYRTAALIPGVRVIRGVPNADGQRGIAVAIKDGGSWREWIFNPATLLPIGMREMGRSATASYPGGNAILVTGIVSRIGQVPGGSH